MHVKSIRFEKEEAKTSCSNLTVNSCYVSQFMLCMKSVSHKLLDIILQYMYTLYFHIGSALFGKAPASFGHSQRETI